VRRDICRHLHIRPGHALAAAARRVVRSFAMATIRYSFRPSLFQAERTIVVVKAREE
jgi:hypothetical protein